tara:strand:- start:157 stop:345 length:189 start_codon:yes stop_codon:yes gene_type:complete
MFGVRPLRQGITPQGYNALLFGVLMVGQSTVQYYTLVLEEEAMLAVIFKFIVGMEVVMAGII